MQTVFLELVKLSLIGSLFAAAVMLVRLVFPKTPRWIFCLLWGVVALRLICPLSIESSISLVPDRIASGQIITNVGNEYIGDVDIIHENDTGYRDAVEAGRQPVYSDDGYYVVTKKDSLEVPKTVGQTLYPILSWIWVAGMVSMLIYTVVSFLVLRRKMAEATRLWDNIWQCEQVDSPFVLGFFKPKIYLPYHITDPDIENVIAHEKAHIHRRDHWWKPIGFILLSIHWFNPVLWLAYVMFCQDIEAACDEKVIKHMEKDEMRAYSTALLNCSVNRRRIAACPLAFGEVGVKERVKTVMNYKKPAFWIVIAAVALCIVVAVCFLTNPVDTSKEFDSSMLEYPGLKWGMTVDEVKAALNISQDQITAEGTVSSTTYFVAKDLTLFDYPLKGAGFYFSQSDDGVCFLNNISAYFPEETDMAQVRDTMIEIYGDGDTWSGQNYQIKPDGELATYVEVKKNSNRLQHYWRVSGKVDTVVDDMEAVIDFYANAYPKASRETIEEYLQKVHTAGIGLVDTADPSGALVDSSVATKNVVQFYSAGLVWHMIHFGKVVGNRTVNTATIEPQKSPDLPLLCFPDIAWGATPEEVKQILGVTEEQILLDEALLDRYVLQIKDFTFLGNEVLCGQFNFIASDSGQYHFTDVTLHYPEETDMTLVKDGLTVFYGQPKDGRGFTRYQITNIASVQDYTDYGVNTLFFPGDTPVEGWWESGVTLGDVLPEDVQNKLITRAILLNDGNEDFGEATCKYLDKEPAMLICCTNGSVSADDTFPYYTKNVVMLSALRYIASMIN